MAPTTNPYKQVFQIEFDAYAEAIEQYPGEIFPELVFRVVRELEESFVAAILHEYAFDIFAVARQLAHASKFIVHEKDIVFCILSVLPPTGSMNESAMYALAQIIDQVEREYGGALERLEKKWRWEKKYERDNRRKVA